MTLATSPDVTSIVIFYTIVGCAIAATVLVLCCISIVGNIEPTDGDPATDRESTEPASQSTLASSNEKDLYGSRV